MASIKISPSILSADFSKLGSEIQNLEKDIKRLELILGQSDLFNTQPEKFKKATELLIDCQKKLESAELEWLKLAEKEPN